MAAIDDLRSKVMKKKYGVEDIVEGIANVLKRFGFKVGDGSIGFYNINDLSGVHPYFEYMVEMGLISVGQGGRIPISVGRDKRNNTTVIEYAKTFGEIRFTEKARDMYKKLEEEGYYLDLAKKSNRFLS